MLLRSYIITATLFYQLTIMTQQKYLPFRLSGYGRDAIPS